DCPRRNRTWRSRIWSAFKKNSAIGAPNPSDRRRDPDATLLRFLPNPKTGGGCEEFLFRIVAADRADLARANVSGRVPFGHFISSNRGASARKCRQSDEQRRHHDFVQYRRRGDRSIARRICFAATTWFSNE